MNERGAVLVTALMILTVLAVLSLAAVMSATQGLRITSGYRNDQQLLYQSDGGADYSYSLVARALANNHKVSSTDTANSYVSVNTTDTDGDGTTDLEAELAGLTVNDPDTTTATPDLTLDLAGDPVAIDIDFVKTKLIAGSSSEFAARYEGIGAGTSGGVGVYYKIDALSKESGADDVYSSKSTVRIRYKCIEGGGRCL